MIQFKFPGKVSNEFKSSFKQYKILLQRLIVIKMNANDQSSEDVLRARFYDWLISNGAKFPKIKWPSMETASGIRGAIATETIATGEHMIEIPIHLMMSPPAAFADPEIGIEMKAVEDMFNGDLLLTVYIMHELRKGDKSFYSPFLSILPEPGNISEWNEEELAELQVIFSFLMLLKCYSK